MNVLFVYSLYNIASLRKPIESPEIIQFGLSYLSAFLKKQGHNTKLLVMSRISGTKNEALIDEYIKRFKPRVIAFSSISTEYNFVVSVAQYLQRWHSDIYLIIGGVHVSLNPDGVLEHFDALCIGEGEQPLLELVTQLGNGKEPSGIKNLWIRHGKTIEKIQTRPYIHDLDIIPFPDRDIWNEWIDAPVDARHTVLLGRGCPFECTYCSNHALKKLSSGKYTRYRSPDNISQEIQKLIKSNPRVKELYLEVESIGVKKEWVKELCAKLAEFNKTLSNSITFGTNIRIMPGIDLDTIFAAFKKANIRFINIGLESGSERIRKVVLNRHYSNNDIIKAVEKAREYGLKVSFLNMIGLPEETLAEHAETVQVNRICQPDWIGHSIFYPYQGTKLYKYCLEKGLVKEPLATDMERSRATLNLPGFNKRQIQNAYVWFEYNVYKGHRPLKQLLWKTMGFKIRSMPLLYSIFKAITIGMKKNLDQISRDNLLKSYFYKTVR